MWSVENEREVVVFFGVVFGAHVNFIFKIEKSPKLESGQWQRSRLRADYRWESFAQ